MPGEENLTPTASHAIVDVEMSAWGQKRTFRDLRTSPLYHDSGHAERDYDDRFVPQADVLPQNSLARLVGAGPMPTPHFV